MPRRDGRANSELRPIVIECDTMPYAEGSCEVRFGMTRVICSASVEERVPQWMKRDAPGEGWVTAEYAMLPRSCRERTARERSALGGRTMEIQRLIGRSLRSVVDTQSLGERTITIDCDVLHADGGTRTAAITGSYVALARAVGWMLEERLIKKSPLTGIVAAVSVGVVQGETMLDLCYEEDRYASVDMNVVMAEQGRFVEVQGTAEGNPFDRATLNALLDLAQKGIHQLHAAQREAISRPRSAA